MGLEEFILGVSSSGMIFLPDVINAISTIVYGECLEKICSVAMSQFSARVCEIWSFGYQIMVLLILAIYLCKSFRIRVSFPWKG